MTGSARSPSAAGADRQPGAVPADLQIDPDAVDDMARLARRIADDLDDLPVGNLGTPTALHRAVDELLAFATAADVAARRAREADLATADRFAEVRR